MIAFSLQRVGEKKIIEYIRGRRVRIMDVGSFVKQPAAFHIHLLLMEKHFLWLWMSLIQSDYNMSRSWVFVWTQPVCRAVFEISRAEYFSFSCFHPAEQYCTQAGALPVFVIVTSFSVSRAAVTEIWTDGLGVCVQSPSPAVCYLTSTLMLHIRCKSSQVSSLHFRAGPRK